MFVPISSFANNQVQSSGRLTPVGRASAVDFRTNRTERDTDTIVHLSDEARAILAGALPASEVTVVPARDPADEPAAEETVEAEFEQVFEPGQPGDAAQAAEAQSQSHDAKPAFGAGTPRATPEQERAVQQLRARDTEVRAHEAAHAAAAGSLGGRPSLEYVVGPDGRRYAVAGEVSVDTSPGRTPEETIARARTIRAAATAPASPSAQDMAVASAAARMESEAQSAIRERQQFESRARAEQASAEPVKPDTVRRVEWSRVGGASRAEPANTVQAPAPVVERAAAPAKEAVAASDTEMMMLQLVREQVSSRGGMGHTHLSSGCGFCRRAAATYA